MKDIIRRIYTYLALVFCFLLLIIPEKIQIWFLGFEMGILVTMLIKIGGKKDE